MQIVGPDWMSAQIDSPKFDIVARIPEGMSNAQVPEMFQTLLADRFKLTVHRGTQEQNVLALVVDRGGQKLKPALTEAAVLAPDPGAACPGQEGGCLVRIRDVDGEQVVLTETSPGITSYTSPSIGTALRTALPGDIVRIRTVAPSTTLAGLAILASLLPTNQPPIVDMTGIAGRYEVEIGTPLYVRSANDRLGPLSHAAEAAGRDGTPEGEAWRAAVTEEATNAGIVAQRALEADLRKLGLRLEPRRIPVNAIVVDHVEKSPTEN